MLCKPHAANQHYECDARLADVRTVNKVWLPKTFCPDQWWHNVVITAKSFYFMHNLAFVMRQEKKKDAARFCQPGPGTVGVTLR